MPDHSTFSVNRHDRFRDSDLLRHVFEAVVRACMDAGLVKDEGFAVDASVMEAESGGTTFSVARTQLLSAVVAGTVAANETANNPSKRNRVIAR